MVIASKRNKSQTTIYDICKGLCWPPNVSQYLDDNERLKDNSNLL